MSLMYVEHYEYDMPGEEAKEQGVQFYGGHAVLW